MPDRRTASPLLEPAAASAHALGWEVLDRIRAAGDDVVDLLLPDSITGRLQRGWHPLSIDHGDLGLALVYAAADEADPDGGWDERAFVHVQRFVAAYQQIDDLGIGLFGGTAGVAFALRALSRGGTRYRQALHDVEAVLDHRVRAHLDRLDVRAGLASADYDYVSGLSGVGVCLLQLPDGPGPLRDCAVLAATVLSEAALAPAPAGLWTPPDKLTPVERTHHPQLWSGYLNLGLAHGIAGVLTFLGLARRRGLVVPRLDEAVGSLQARLWEHGRPTPYGPDLPYYAPREAAGRSQTELTRTAWCYGNPGAALALHQADLPGTPSPRTDEQVRALMASVDERPAERRGIDNASLCHGWAGLALVQRRLGVGDAGRAAVEELLRRADPTARFGLRNQIAPGLPTDSPGFLEGVGGAAALLVGWDRDPAVPGVLEQLLGAGAPA